MSDRPGKGPAGATGHSAKRTPRYGIIIISIVTIHESGTVLTAFHMSPMKPSQQPILQMKELRLREGNDFPKVIPKISGRAGS